MKKIIVLALLVFGSSSALAQRHVPGGGPVGHPGNPGTHQPGRGGGQSGGGGRVHVPGGGPVGHPGNPGTYQPPRNFPNYPPNYPSYPVPNYPTNNYPGPCVINEYYSNGYVYYQLIDGRGYNSIQSSDYYMVLNTAQQYNRNGMCNGLINNTRSGGQYPTPNGCQIMPGRDAYGNNFYRVIDRAGRIIMNTSIYQQAVQVSQSDPRCFQ